MNTASVISIEELAARLTGNARLIGLDVGAKTIGMALSDLTRRVATPRDTIRRTKFTQDVQQLQKTMDENEVFAVIIGLPVNMDGSEGPRAQSTRAFARNLSQHIALPIVFWDERLSTVAVERTLIEADASRRKRAGVIDKMAAAFILQGALDRLANIARST